MVAVAVRVATFHSRMVPSQYPVARVLVLLSGENDIEKLILVHRGVNHAPYRHEQQNLLDCG